MTSTNEKLKDLMGQKESLEKDLKVLNFILVSQKNVGMTGSLLDTDGYPRSDIDVYVVRYARHKASIIINDHKSIMNNIEELLLELHGSAPMDTSDQVDDSSPSSFDDQVTFLRIESVLTNSPAYNAGLKLGDELVQFGSLNASNFSSLMDVSKVAGFSKGHPLDLIVRRNGGAKLHLSITPKEWPGNGLLGCSMKPIKK